MTELRLNDPAAFGAKLIELYLEQGFQSLPKRDFDLLIYILLEIDGTIRRHESSYEVARRLRITPARVKALRRDAYARWRPLLSETRSDALKRILKEVLTPANLSAGASHASEKNRDDGFLAVRIEHPDDRSEFEQAIVDAGAIPVYERNRDVLATRFDTLLRIAEMQQFVADDPDAVRKQLKKLAAVTDDIQELLTKPVEDLTWADTRAAANAIGAKMVAGTLDARLTDLLKIFFPFLG